MLELLNENIPLNNTESANPSSKASPKSAPIAKFIPVPITVPTPTPIAKLAIKGKANPPVNKVKPRPIKNKPIPTRVFCHHGILLYQLKVLLQKPCHFVKAGGSQASGIPVNMLHPFTGK